MPFLCVRSAVPMPTPWKEIVAACLNNHGTKAVARAKYLGQGEAIRGPPVSLWRHCWL